MVQELSVFQDTSAFFLDARAMKTANWPGLSPFSLFSGLSVLKADLDSGVLSAPRSLSSLSPVKRPLPPMTFKITL